MSDEDLPERGSVRVAIVGAGALGQLVGAVVDSQTTATVTLLSRRADAVAAIRAGGVTVRLLATGGGELQAWPAAELADEVPSASFDVVLLLNKTQDIDWATAVGRRVAAPDGAIVALQNGLTCADAVEAADARGVAGTINTGANYVGPGSVEHTVLGPLRAAPSPERVDRVATLIKSLESELLPVAIVPDRDAMLWEKMVGAVSNAVSGALLLPVSSISRSASAWELLDRARAEVLDVAQAAGVQLDRAAIEAKFAARVPSPHNPGSTYQSLISGRPSEDLFGAVEEIALRNDVRTPVIGALRLLQAAREECAWAQ